MPFVKLQHLPDFLTKATLNLTASWPKRHCTTKTAAYVCFGELPDAREGTFEIFWLSTLNSFRGCGIGHQLFSRLSEILKERDAQKLYVKTDNTDQYYPTRKFYEKCGFRREAVLKEYYDRKDDCCIYGMDFAKEEEQYLEAAE